MTRMVRSPGSCWVWGAGESEERRSGGQAGAGGREGRLGSSVVMI